MINLNTELLSFDIQAEINNRKSEIERSLSTLVSRKDDKNDWVGWLDLHADDQMYADIQKYAQSVIASDKFDNLIILGIGGSALGPQALIQALYGPVWNEKTKDQRNGGLKVYFVDNVDPDWVSEIFSHIDIKRSLFCVITKSGGTAETVAPFLWAKNALKKELGSGWTQNMVAITDPASGKLRAFVNENNLTAFSVEPNVGGRFSVFSPVGLLPLALLGCDIREFQKGLTQAYADMVTAGNNGKNIAVSLAIALIHADQKLGRNINVLMPYSTCLSRVSDWYVQLTAESLGKNRNVGPTPIKAVGATDQHSQLQLFAEGPLDKIIFFIKVNNFANSVDVPKEEVKGFENLAGETLTRLIHAEGEATAKAVSKKEVPSLTLEVDKVTPASLAYLLYAFELMTAIAGDLYGIDPFNQPGVELSKKYTYALLGKPGFEEYLKDIK